jgi:flagellar basal-body rod modification protein FlgD
MTIASVSSNSQTAAAATTASLSASSSSAMSSSTGASKDDFLKLLVAQLSHQDPTQPQEGTEFVTQLAQFSLVEQSENQSTALTNLTTQMSGLAANQATDLIGQQVALKSSGLTWDGTNAPTTSVNLGADSASTTVQIQDSSGTTVRTMQMGAQPAGPLTITWDGKTDAGQSATQGTYTTSVLATTSSGAQVNASSAVSGKVTQVTYDKGYPEVTLDSGVTASISELVSVGSGATVK